jgi:glycosyltransferase involved in cell wall biosynthesis
VEPEAYPDIEPSQRAHGRADNIDLVWIGSSSTLRGLEQQHALWERIGRAVPGLRLRVICDRFPHLPSIRVVPIPWSEEWEARDLASGHIGISWLPDDPWSRGKCGLKVLQYQAARLSVIANPVGMNAELIEPGVTGFLPESTDEWVEAVQVLASDPQRRRDMGQIARRRVESEYSVEAWADTFVASVTGMEKPANGGSSLIRSSSEGSIPDPFFVRLRRAGVFPHSALLGDLQGSGKPD